MWKCVLLVIAACASNRACPPPVKPVAVVETDDLPAPDDQLKRWQAIHANKDQPPDGTTAAALLPELVAYLGSPDPVRRDGIAFEVLVNWIARDPKLSPDEVRTLALELQANLSGPLDVRDGVFKRSFSALVLSLVAARDVAAPFLTDDERRAMLAALRAYADRETDLRGHTGARGWAHAAAHTADALKFLAREPNFTDTDRATILDAVNALTVRRHGAIFHHGEDTRLAQPVIEALRRGVPDDRFDTFLAALIAPLKEGDAAAFEPKLYAAQRNARNLLFTLYVQLSLDPKPSDDVKRAADAIRALIAG
jgi:hypothetical protein